MIPSWWQFVLLTLAAFRVFRLLAEDTILDRPRARLLGVPGWNPADDEPPPEGFREGLAGFLTCPFCLGAWIAFAWWGAWMLAPRVTIVIATPWAVSAVVALVAKNLDR